MNQSKQLFTITAWPMGTAQFFPSCDYLYVQREKKRFFRTKEEQGLVSYENAMKVIAPLLDDFEVRNLRFKYLRPENTADAASLVHELTLDPIDLSQQTRMRPDSFHDVELA
jgi:hypothetical protein